ncbi:MAG: transglutaminase domain-containing protein, partial [Planctomycetota bacterium]
MMKPSLHLSSLLLCFLTLSSGIAGADETHEPKAKQRELVFHYDFRLHDLQLGKELRVWLPVPKSDSWQQIELLGKTKDASDKVLDFRKTTESKYGNQLLYAEIEVPSSGELSVRQAYRVKRKEVLFGTRAPTASGLKARNKQELAGAKSFLAANQFVPLEGKQLALLAGRKLPANALEKAEAIYEIVDEHVRYSKEGKGWGNGDVAWVCDSRYGNCTDFHSLFISMARSQGIPAKFEIGFPIPTGDQGKVAGYHCWAWFHTDAKGWVPVDISEADKHPELKEYYFGNLTADRIAFSTG